MAIASCPKCATKLKVPDGASASVRCPKCQTVFKTNPPAQPAFEVVDEAPPKPAPRPSAAAKPAPKPASPADDFEVVDEAPAKKKVVAKTDLDDDEDRPRKKRSRDDDDDDDDDRPRSKKRSRDDDDDDDDRPRKSKRSSRDDIGYAPPGKGSKIGLARVGVLLVLISLGLYAGSVALQVLFILIALIGGVIPGGLTLTTGILGLLNWIVGLVGLGFCIASPKGRGLAIAALSVAAVHLILALIVVNDGDSIIGSNLAVPVLSSFNRSENVQSLSKELQKEESKNPGSARAKELREDLKSYQDDSRADGLVFGEGTSSRSSMRWGDLTTLQPHFDKLIAVLSYSSKLFSKFLLGMFCGMAELARLILICLLLGWLAGAAREYGAESKAKIGWIATASASGACLLIMLLAVVMAESAAKDAVKAASADFSTVQSEADFVKLREKQTSAARAPIRWYAIGELLVMMLHAGTVVMPGLAAMQIYSATRGVGNRGNTRSRIRDDD